MSNKARSNNKSGAKRHNAPRSADIYVEPAARKPVRKQKKSAKKQEPTMPKQNKFVLWLCVIFLGLCLIFPNLLATLSPTLVVVLRIVCVIGIVLAIVATYRGKYDPNPEFDERPISKFIPALFSKILKRRDDEDEYDDEEEWDEEDDWDDDDFEGEEEEPSFVPLPGFRRPTQQSDPLSPVAVRKCECGVELPAKAKFCLECGKPVPQKHVCACGAELPEKAKFCFECGKPVATAPAARPKPTGTKPEGGKK